MEKITDPSAHGSEQVTMDLFSPCPAKHISGRQCEHKLGHRNTGLPHVYTAQSNGGIWPVWWDEHGDVNLPAFVICPVKRCPKVETVHPVTPDSALLTMLVHFQRSHSDMDPMTLLDAIRWD